MRDINKRNWDKRGKNKWSDEKCIVYIVNDYVSPNIEMIQRVGRRKYNRELRAETIAEVLAELLRHMLNVNNWHTAMDIVLGKAQEHQYQKDI